MSFTGQRKQLVESLKASGNLRSRRVISAFQNVKRHEFVPTGIKNLAYSDEPLPIGEGQTISQPTTVSIMTEAIEPRSGHRILEIGTGSGYQAAILAEVVGSKGLIITLERLPLLYEFGKYNLRNYRNVEVFCADGTRGYPYKAPYDRILVAAGASKVPEHLVNQLKEGGILIIPVKGKMLKVQKVGSKKEVMELGHFAFVPLVGDY